MAAVSQAKVSLRACAGCKATTVDLTLEASQATATSVAATEGERRRAAVAGVVRIGGDCCVRRYRIAQFVSAFITGAAAGPRDATLVSCRASGIVGSIDGRAAGQQGVGFGRATVVGQRAKQRVDRAGAGANLIVVDAIGDTGGAGAVADQVVRASGNHGAADIIPAGNGGIEVSGHNRVAQGDRRRVLRKATACAAAVVVVVSSVVGDGDVGQGGVARPAARGDKIGAAAVVVGVIARDSAVDDGDRPLVAGGGDAAAVAEAAAGHAGAVAGDRAVINVGRDRRP